MEVRSERARGRGAVKKRVHSKEVHLVRHFSRAGIDPLDKVNYVRTNSRITEPDGSLVFEMKDVEVPAAWSQLAVDILVSKYFRKAGVPGTGHEVSVRQVVSRIADTLAQAGEARGYFSAAQAAVFRDELAALLIDQYGAFNSPVWFNLGLYHKYGIAGSGGNFVWDPQTGKAVKTQDSYSHPQCSACFIQAADDDLMGIFNLMQNEARLFKYGSGTGSNFSKIRGHQERLSSGGYSSGLMSFLEVLDRGAGATKSGGTTRRAAKMVCLDMDHPEIVDFITWKSREEKKVAALVAAGYSADFNGEAYRTVSGQNSNNSLRITDEFMRAVQEDKEWSTKARTTGAVVNTYRARELWEMIAESAWACADPGVQYDTTINEWHTCPESGRINASNPCSEYMFLDDTACNLASLNLTKFLDDRGNFDVKAFKAAVQVFITAQDILVDFSSYPTVAIAENSHSYRSLGIGYANLGTMLMIKGIPYDSDEGRAWAGAVTAIMTGEAYAASAELAKSLGAFEGYEKNREAMLKVIRNHENRVNGIPADKIPADLREAAAGVWREALEKGERYGYRNAQVSVLAPTGTIGLLMDCDTTGVEPDFALVKFKKLTGGGYFKIVNQSVPKALATLGYSKLESEEIIRHVLGRMSFSGATVVNQDYLRQKGMSVAAIESIEKKLKGAFDLESLFTKFALGEELLKELGVKPEDYEKADFNLLKAWGLSESQIEFANRELCGTMTVEGAPHLKEEHLPVFDCANRCGKTGTRFIAPVGHLRMMAAAQPFLSGAISKTVNLPNDATVEDIKAIYTEGWKLGLKAVALYRDGCKQSQPLSTKSNAKAKTDPTAAAEAYNNAPVGAQITYAPVRNRLPAKRRGFTQEASVAGHKVFLRTGEFEDGSVGEIFIDMHKEGAAYRSMMNCFAIAVSLGLQYGVPLKEYVDKFTFTRFDPSGIVTGHPNVKLATSIVDYIFRVLGMEYLGRTDFLQVKPAVDLMQDKAFVPQLGLNIPAPEPQAPNYLAEMMGDAPPCDQCGHTTVRNGSCYRCLNCGNSMGCS
jgi:ribonucleoside-diphosphate reductase alpha chain